MFRHTFVSILLSNPNIGVATVAAEAGHDQLSTTLAIYTQIIHAIEAHHGDVEPKTPLAFIIQAADAISAARPGARRENVESYVKRLENLEEISSSFEGVEQAFAVQAGREVRIMVKPDVISDDQVILLARSIAKKIEDTLDYPGQIKVNVIRESRAVEYAK
jgi:ribonuclease Y